MRLARLLLLTAAACMPVSLLACDKPTDESVVIERTSDTAICSKLFDQFEQLVEEVRQLSVFSDANEKKNDYWSEWTYAIAQDPMISSQLAHNKLGIGFWSPDGSQPEDYEDYQTWLRDQGVQLTLGVGGTDNESVRFRLDYLWHQSTKAGVVMQVELPF